MLAVGEATGRRNVGPPARTTCVTSPGKDAIIFTKIDLEFLTAWYNVLFRLDTVVVVAFALHKT